MNQSCNPSKNLFNSLFIHESGLIQANTICTAVYGSSDMKRLVGNLYLAIPTKQIIAYNSTTSQYHLFDAPSLFTRGFINFIIFCVVVTTSKARSLMFGRTIKLGNDSIVPVAKFLIASMSGPIIIIF